MDGGFQDRRRMGSVKAAVNLYGEKAVKDKSPLKKPQTDYSEQSKKDSGRFSKKTAAASAKEAEAELLRAKKMVRDLASRIEESKSRTKVQTEYLEKVKKSRRAGGSDELRSGQSNQYAKVMRELRHVKEELSKLKLDMAPLLEEKRRAEKEREASSSRLLSYSATVESLQKEIDEVNEEHVLVELARIEALKELGEFEAQRKEAAGQHSAAMEDIKNRKSCVIQEIDDAEELEEQLAITTFDVNMLKNELEQFKELDRKIQKNENLGRSQSSLLPANELDSPTLLSSLTEELEEAKKELVSVQDESFQFMASMDVVRNEIKHVIEERTRLQKMEEKAELTIQNLNSKLLRAKAKLEAATTAEEKSKSIVSNLSLTLEQLKTETEAAKKEKMHIDEETASLKAGIRKTESEIDLVEERLQAAMQELEMVKSSEMNALENLKALIQNAVRNRASASQHKSTITISKFEYEYLTGTAVKAGEIADRKVAAAQAWIEALRASEKEILMKVEIAKREKSELRPQKDNAHKPERSSSTKRVVEKELKYWGRQYEKISQPEDSQTNRRRSQSGKLTPSRRPKFRISASPAARNTPRSTSLTVKKKKKVMPNLAKFFSGKSVDGDS